MLRAVHLTVKPQRWRICCVRSHCVRIRAMAQDAAAQEGVAQTRMQKTNAKEFYCLTEKDVRELTHFWRQRSHSQLLVLAGAAGASDLSGETKQEIQKCHSYQTVQHSRGSPFCLVLHTCSLPALIRLWSQVCCKARLSADGSKAVKSATCRSC